MSCSFGGLNANVLLAECIPTKLTFGSYCGAELLAAQVGGSVVGGGFVGSGVGANA